MKNTVVEKDPVKLAADNARTPDLTRGGVAGRLQVKARGMLPIEEDASMKVVAEAKRLEPDVDPKGVLTHFPDAKLLDTSAFMMRRPDTKLPTLAPFSLNSPDVSMGKGAKGFSEHFPVSLRKFYEDVDGVLNTSRENWNFGAIMFVTCAIFLGLWALTFQQLGMNPESKVVTLLVLLILLIPAFVMLMCWIAFFIEDRSKTTSFFSPQRDWPSRVGQALMLTPLALPVAFSLIIMVALEGIIKAREIRARFGGILPDDVRALARKASHSPLFDEVFILAEVPKWQIKETETPLLSRNGDPLLIGYEGGRYWLLAAFDVTPVEQYVADELATNPAV